MSKKVAVKRAPKKEVFHEEQPKVDGNVKESATVTEPTQDEKKDNALRVLYSCLVYLRDDVVLNNLPAIAVINNALKQADPHV